MLGIGWTLSSCAVVAREHGNFRGLAFVAALRKASDLDLTVATSSQVGVGPTTLVVQLVEPSVI